MPLDPVALRRIRAFEKDFGAGYDRLPWSTPQDALRALSFDAQKKVAVFRARVGRAWLSPDPRFALATAFAAVDPRSRVAVYPNAAPGGLRWQVNSIGGTLTTAPIKNQGLMPALRQYVLHGTDPFADTPVLNGPLMRANVSGVADPTQYFDVLLGPNDAVQQLRMVTYDQRDASLFAGWYRDAHGVPFTLDDHALLMALRPTLLLWHRLAKALGPLPLGEGVLCDTLAALTQPALLARKKRIIYTNQLGRASLPDVVAWLHAGRPAGYATSVPLAPGGFGVELILPATVAVPQADGGARDLEKRFKLTHTEARVAVGVARGGSLRDLATELGISYETARTHLKRIYGKVGVSRQAELVNKVLRG